MREEKDLLPKNNRIAVFIDADNVAPWFLRNALKKLRTMGSIEINMAYGNWENERFRQRDEWDVLFRKYKVNAYDFTLGRRYKNMTDIELTIGVMDAYYQHSDINMFCIISQDSDFIPIVDRMRDNGKVTVGFGTVHFNKKLLSSCDIFFSMKKGSKELSVQKVVRPINGNFL